MISRWPFYASVALLGCESILCFLAGSIEWGVRGAMVGIDSAETAEQARFAIELYAIGALYVLGLIAFLLQRSGGAWWLVLGMQMGVFVLALIEGMLTDMGWVFFSGLPLLSGLLLFAFLNASAASPVGSHQAGKATKPHWRAPLLAMGRSGRGFGRDPHQPSDVGELTRSLILAPVRRVRTRLRRHDASNRYRCEPSGR